MGQFTDTVLDILKDGTHEEVDMVRKLLLKQEEEMTELKRKGDVCFCKLQDQRSREVLHQVEEKPWKGWYLCISNTTIIFSMHSRCMYIVLIYIHHEAERYQYPLMQLDTHSLAR